MAEHKKSKSDRYIIGAFVAIGIISYFAFRIIIEPELIPITVLMLVFSLILAGVSLILLAIIKALNLKISGLPGDGLSEERPLEGAIPVETQGGNVKCFKCKVNVNSGNVYSRECKRNEEGCYDMRMVCEACAQKMYGRDYIRR
jgi:hypothetical protein